MQAIIRLLRGFRQAKKGVSNVIVVMLSLILIVMIVSNVILWSYQMNQLDWEKMQEKIEIVGVSSTASAWYYPDFSYRVQHNITGSTAGNVTNYQMKITIVNGTGTSGESVHYTTNVNQPDFDDVRFTWYNNTSGLEQPIPYWCEVVYDGVNATFWVKVPEIPASPSLTTIFIYYGNPTAATTSDSVAVFGKAISARYTQGDYDNYYDAFILSSREWISGGTNLGISGDDNGTSRTLPFPVPIYGTSVSAVYLSTNGLLRWDNTVDIRYSNFLDTANKILTAHWDDLYISTSYRSDAGIYEITGTDVNLGQYIIYRWATTYFGYIYTPADFEITFYKSGCIQFNIYRVRSTATPNEYISKGDSANYIDLTPRWSNVESILFVPRVYPEPSHGAWGSEDVYGRMTLTLRNIGASTTHIVSIWVNNSTFHKPYPTDIFISPGETVTYSFIDKNLPISNYIVKVVSERGNIAVISNP